MKRDKWLMIWLTIYILLVIAIIALAIISPNDFVAAQSKVRLAPISVIVPAIIAGR